MNKNTLTLEEAINLANLYINNIDPNTGEVLEEKNLDDLLINTLKTLIDLDIDDLKKLLNKKCGYPLRRGFAWSQEEDIQLTKEFQSGVGVKDIAINHKRSMNAISARLKHLNLVDTNVDLPRHTFKNYFSIGYWYESIKKI